MSKVSPYQFMTDLQEQFREQAERSYRLAEESAIEVEKARERLRIAEEAYRVASERVKEIGAQIAALEAERDAP